MAGEGRADDLVRFEQQIRALPGGRRVRQLEEIAFRPRDVAGGQACHGQAATLPPVLLRIAALPLFIRGERLVVPAAQKERVPEVG